MKEIFKNKKLLIGITSLLIIIVISSFSYAYYIFTATQEDAHIGSTKCFKLSFTESNDITLQDAYPLTDEEANNLTPYTFTIENICDLASSYYVTIEDLSDSTMDLNGIKYQLDNNTPQVLGNIVSNQNKVLTGAKSSRTLASGILLKNESITYNLKLWIDINSTKEQTAGKILNSKVVIVSNWNKNPYWNLTLSDELNGNSEIQVVKGRSIGDLQSPTKENYEFLGWYDSNDNEITSSSILNSDTTIYARWLKLIWTITYDKNGGNSISKDSEEINRGDRILSMPTGTRNSDNEHNYALEGWYTDASGGNKIDENSDINSDMTLYAHWTPSTRYYRITYDSNGGNTPSKTSDSVTYNGSITSLATCTKSQSNTYTYTLKGWYDATSGGNQITTSTKFTSNKTIYAQWTPTYRNYTITYDGNGGTPARSSDSKHYNDSVTLPSASRSSSSNYSYSFNGWYTSSSGGTKIGNAGDSYTVTSSTTLYARWSSSTRYYTITYNGNGGTAGRSSDSSKTYNTTVTLPTATKAADGSYTYTFDGWYTSSSGGTKKGNAGDSYTITSSTTLYAHWKSTAKSCTITKYGTSNSIWKAVYSCVGGSGTMTQCYYGSTLCNGGTRPAPSAIYGCTQKGAILGTPYSDCNSSLNSAAHDQGGGLDKTISCSCS